MNNSPILPILKEHPEIEKMNTIPKKYPRKKIFKRVKNTLRTVMNFNSSKLTEDNSITRTPELRAKPKKKRQGTFFKKNGV